MNIKYTPVDISARVKDLENKKDVMQDLTVMVDCVDQDSGISVFYQLHYRYPEQNTYTDESPFVEFDNISEEHVMSFIQDLINNSLHMHEWAEKRIQEIIDEPVKKLFSFQKSASQTFESDVEISNVLSSQETSN
jgi:hypothetical protein